MSKTAKQSLVLALALVVLSSLGNPCAAAERSAVKPYRVIFT